MNPSAEQHLAKAKEYIAKGDEFYRAAKPEIDAAKAEGATLMEISRILEKSHQWVADVLKWDGIGTLYGKDSDRRRLDMAKQVARTNPSAIIEGLSEDERLELASAALEPSRRQGEQEKQQRRAVREEHQVDPDSTHYRIVMLDIAKAEGALGDGTTIARDARFSDENRTRLLARLNVTTDMVDVLRLAISGAENVDWDEELRRINEAARAAEGV